MKGKPFLTFPTLTGDLDRYPDSWVGETVSQRDSRILSDIRAYRVKKLGLEKESDIEELERIKPYALVPSSKIMFIREVVFPVPEELTLSALKEIAPRIYENFTIDCFQVALDHAAHQAHMLFDWYDRDTGNCVYLYPSRRIRFSVFIVRELGLPRPEGYEQWLRHFLLEDFKEDENVFQNWAEQVKYVRLGRRGYNVVCDALLYAEMVCRRLVK